MTGHCAKMRVKARLVSRSGNIYWGENDCLNPQEICPRNDMPSGVGYELCQSVCRQTAHAEVNAIRSAGDDAFDSEIFLYGHSYACENCSGAAFDVRAKIIVTGDPAID